MIRHVVIFKTKHNAPLNEFKEKIENLRYYIPEIIDIQVGIDVKFDPTSSDFCVITELLDINDLKIYANHPEHLKVIEFIKPFVIQRSVVDYEL